MSPLKPYGGDAIVTVVYGTRATLVAAHGVWVGANGEGGVLVKVHVTAEKCERHIPQNEPELTIRHSRQMPKRSLTAPPPLAKSVRAADGGTVGLEVGHSFLMKSLPKKSTT